MTKVAYGFTIRGLDDCEYLHLNGDAPAEVLNVRQVPEDHPGEDSYVEPDHSVLRHRHGATVTDRATRTVTFHGSPLLSVNEIVHPLLWPAAAISASWLGRETLHGGGFLDDSGAAWVVLGASGDGKSSLLAALARRGRTILCDDLVVVDHDRCFAGPRCIDLTSHTAQALGVEGDTVTVRWSQRQRLALEPMAVAVPLRGFVHLSWSTGLGVESLPAGERLRRLANNRRVLELGVEPLYLLELGSLPAVVLSRPRDWRKLDATCELLLDATA